MNPEGSSTQVVGIGASAGGLDALKEFFTAMPADSGLGFVVVQHLDPGHVSYMASLLAKCTDMRVVQAEDRSPIERNCVYTIPPNKFLFVKDGMLHLTEPVKRDGIRMPIDFFFRSLAEDQHEKAIAMLFSGSGTDGTLGIREIRGANGIVIVQDPKTAQFGNMIESAIETGMVDCVLPVGEISGALLHYVRQSPVEPTDADSEGGRDHLGSIIDLLGSQTKNDFRFYKNSTLQRRIARRMGLHRIGDFSEYYRFLLQDSDELARLSKDMLISVTSFFRDPEAFAVLADNVIKPLVQEANNDRALRVWVTGCATGEEAYSIAMLLMEESARSRKRSPLQVFASDIDHDALKYAREGIYPESISADVSEERLARFFNKKDHVYQVNKEIREVMTFAAHNVIMDPPFMKLDLISCRNLLIYIEPEIQKKILSLFGFALTPDGYLFLGKSETTVEQSDLFEPVSRSFRIFRRKPSAAVEVANFPTRSGAPAALPLRPERRPSVKLSDLNQQVLLKHFNASLVLIDENGNILHFYGESHKYLKHPFGDANLNLFEMTDDRHSLRLRLAIQKAARENHASKLGALDFTRDDSNYFADVTVIPVVEPKSGNRLLAVIFEDAAAPVKDSPIGVEETEIGRRDDLTERLEAEIAKLRDELQTTIDDFQTTHEELTAANEEVLAINEELQSTNEELETSKEEMQSVNEELTTVNNQLTDKIEELSRTNDDLANFLNSSEVGTIFLDTGFCVRRFTPSATKLLNLIPLDLGRPVSHISNNLIDVDLTSVADNVLKGLVPVEKEVQTSDGRWHVMRSIPYRTLSNLIDGVVFTFTDVTRLKEAQDYAENIVSTVRESLIVLSPELRIVSANRAFCETFKVAREETVGRLIYEVGNRQWDIPRLRELLEEVLPREARFENLEVEHQFPSIGHRIMSLSARRIYDKQQKAVQLILLAIDDITDRKQAEQALHALTQELETRVAERTAELEQANRVLVEYIEERQKLEEQLRHAQKMESVGTLAAGVAHDFNNILNIIQGYASVLRQRAGMDARIAENLCVIDDAIKRGAALVQQLLTIGQKTEEKLEPTDVNTLIHGLLRLLQQTFPKTIEVTLELDSELPPVMASPGQINQALLNLCINARDAMPDGGRLTLRTEAVDGTSLQDSAEAKAERYVRIEVSDTGTGMDENVQSRIFDPFFTTKETGRGTGLGLAMVYGIVKSHNGLIQVKSNPMDGT
ncbi:MAG TPA: CheR family methyltransferase, partial [Candidatus Binatia bacterium]